MVPLDAHRRRMVTINPLTPDLDTPDAFPARRCGRWHHGALIFHAPPHPSAPPAQPGPRPCPLPGARRAAASPPSFVLPSPAAPDPKPPPSGPSYKARYGEKLIAKSPAIKPDGCGIVTKSMNETKTNPAQSCGRRQWPRSGQPPSPAPRRPPRTLRGR